MSYYRYITSVYKSYKPELNRTLRSSSVPRHVPQMDHGRYARSSSVPPSATFSSFFSPRYAATPFRDRATSVPPTSAWKRTVSDAGEGSHYTDFDCKVMDYMGKLRREDTVKNYVSQTRTTRSYQTPAASRPAYPSDSFSIRYNYYDSNKHSSDYLYPITKDVLGSWKHYNLSKQTLTERNIRSTSPLVSRELNRYYGTQKRTDYMGDISSGCATDFRHYNYRRVPYLGGSDNFKYLECKPFRKNSNGSGGRSM